MRTLALAAIFFIGFPPYAAGQTSSGNSPEMRSRLKAAIVADYKVAVEEATKPANTQEERTVTTAGNDEIVELPTYTVVGAEAPRLRVERERIPYIFSGGKIFEVEGRRVTSQVTIQYNPESKGIELFKISW